MADAAPALKQAELAPSRPGFSFLTVAKYWQKIEATSKRLEKLEYLAKLLIRMHIECPSDIPNLLLLIQNIITEPWLGQSVMNIGEQIVKKTVQQTFNVDVTRMKADMVRCGDLGEVCMGYKARQPKMFVKPRPLTVQYVIGAFASIAQTSGANSTQDKQDQMRRLFQDGSDLECKYLVRLLLGRNRLGVQRKSVLSAVSEYACYLQLLETGRLKPFAPAEGVRVVDYIQGCWDKISNIPVTGRIVDAADGGEGEEDEEVDEGESGQGAAALAALAAPDPSSAVDAAPALGDQKPLRELLAALPARKRPARVAQNARATAYLQVLRAFARLPSIPRLAQAAGRLAEIEVTPGVPILPMLARPTASFQEVLERVGSAGFACEYKYDGFRAQVHKRGAELRLFSRAQEDMSARFPDVLEQVRAALVDSELDFVIDGEIVPMDEKGEIAAFQLLARRLQVYEEGQAGQATMFCFDCMYCGDRCLMDWPFEARRAVLRRLFRPSAQHRLARSLDVGSAEQLEAALFEAVAHKTEGLIVKTLAARYCPDRRSRHWLKLKKDYLEGVGDSLDLVPVAGWLGKGKRTGVIGAYLLACRDGQTGLFETVTQLGTGFSDQQLETLTAFFGPERRRARKPREVRAADSYAEGGAPDFWFNPEDSMVFEVKVANLSLSKVHTCAAQLVRDKEQRGIAARLPRLVRERLDKQPSACSTAAFIYERFEAQPDRKAERGDDDVQENDASSSDGGEEEEEFA